MSESERTDNPLWVLVGARGLRSGYRFVMWLTAFVVVTALFGMLAGVLYELSESMGVSIPNGERFLLLGAVAYVPAFFLTAAFALADRERLRSAGVGGPIVRSLLEYVGGFAIGALLVLPTLLPAVVVGDVRIDALAPGWHWARIVVWFVGLAIAAAWEEVAFRGYGFQWLCRATGNVIVYAVRPVFSVDPDRVAQWLSRAFWILLSAVLFAVMHLSNPNASPLAAFNTFLAGIWLSIAVFRTRALWLACGLHLGWNFVQGPILGLPISGMGSESSGMSIPSFWRTTLTGPEWATGGGYGIEAGVPCTVILFVAIGIAALWKPRPRGEDAPVLRPGAM